MQLEDLLPGLDSQLVVLEGSLASFHLGIELRAIGTVFAQNVALQLGQGPGVLVGEHKGHFALALDVLGNGDQLIPSGGNLIASLFKLVHIIEDAHEVAGEGDAVVVAVLKLHGIQVVVHHVPKGLGVVQDLQAALLGKLHELGIGGPVHHHIGDVIGGRPGHQDRRGVGHHVLGDGDVGVLLHKSVDHSLEGIHGLALLLEELDLHIAGNGQLTAGSFTALSRGAALIRSGGGGAAALLGSAAGGGLSASITAGEHCHYHCGSTGDR